MAENLFLPSPSTQKSDIYTAILPQIYALWQHEADVIANLANTTAILKEAFGHLWVGFYRMEGEELVLGPFQGPVACTRIALGKGVCGQAALAQKTLIVPNVHEFPGHIACSSLSNSEIVIPILSSQPSVLGVLDIDSVHFNAFDDTDAQHLTELCDFIARQLERNLG